MIDKTLRSRLNNLSDDETAVFDSPSFDGAIIGLSSDDRVIYSWELMVRELMRDNGCSYDDAAEFLSYNTLRTADYMPHGPIVLMYDRDDILEEMY